MTRAMLRGAVRLATLAIVMTGAACTQPALISCPDDAPPCGGRCVDRAVDDTNCGACGTTCGAGFSCQGGFCVPGQSQGPCATNNGGCSVDAFCDDTSGVPMCFCKPGFVGDGLTCTTCGACGPGQYVAMPCSPFNDTVCADCPPGCSACVPGACTACELGFTLVGDACFPEMMFPCGNGLIEPGEQCDDGNPTDGDGCSHLCQVEAGFFCYGELSSVCQLGGCIGDSLTALPLGGSFALDGNGTASAAGLQLTQRSTIHTTFDVNYPVVIEADVSCSGDDITFAGTRGTGLRVAAVGDEPASSIWARLTESAPFPMEIAIDTGTVIASTSALFAPTIGITYRVRFVDDGYLVRVEWFNATNPTQIEVLPVASSFHGGGDRAFIGGGHLGGVTARNLRVCAAPPLPVTMGLSAHYTAARSWTVLRDQANAVTRWEDTSGNGNHLDVDGTSPIFAAGLLDGKSGLDFSGGARLSTVPFPLTTDMTVFAVVHHNASAQSGAIAHHGNRDTDWSLEQAGPAASADTLHLQTNGDNTNVELTMAPNTTTILTGRFTGNARYFSSTTLSGATSQVAIVDASHTIAAGDKSLFVGSSDAGDASNAYIGEMIYYNRALSDGERDSVIAWLRALWGQ